MVTEPPVVGFGTCEASAVNTGLLTCAQANDRTVQGIGNTVGLGIFKREGCDYEIG